MTTPHALTNRHSTADSEAMTQRRRASIGFLGDWGFLGDFSPTVPIQVCRSRPPGRNHAITMRSSVLAAVLALLQEGSANTARGAHSPIVTPDTRLNPAAQTPTCGDGAALRLRGGSREDRPLKLHHLPRSGLLTAELLGLLALKIFDVGAISALAPPAPPAPSAQARAPLATSASIHAALRR